ncbi:unnamed protein product [Moneuplotes crassus]|uniref:Uncharacterized protein n=1 Tax=Euplotes crassus TaxID=5936 RepID=A0AAD1U9K0_EUPCR|nr:unnamed protein product [Moneuplotes crassus]
MVKLKHDFNHKLSKIKENFEQKHTNLYHDLDEKFEESQVTIKKHIIEQIGGKPLSIDEINQLLATKANRSDLGILDKTKSDKYEIENFLQIVKSLSTQNDHILTLLIEGFKVDIDSKIDTEHSQINKKASVLSQLINLYNWSKKQNLNPSSPDSPKSQIPKSACKKSFNFKLKRQKTVFKSRRESCPTNSYGSESLNHKNASNLMKFSHKVLPKQAASLLQKHKIPMKSLRCQTSHRSRSLTRISFQQTPVKDHEK